MIWLNLIKRTEKVLVFIGTYYLVEMRLKRSRVWIGLTSILKGEKGVLVLERIIKMACILRISFCKDSFWILLKLICKAVLIFWSLLERIIIHLSVRISSQKSLFGSHQSWLKPITKMENLIGTDYGKKFSQTVGGNF